MNISLPARTFVDVYDATGITVGTQLIFTNLTPNDVRLHDSATIPVVGDDHFPLLFGRGSVLNETGDAGSWAMCVAGGAIDVKEAV